MGLCTSTLIYLSLSYPFRSLMHATVLDYNILIVQERTELVNHVSTVHNFQNIPDNSIVFDPVPLGKYILSFYCHFKKTKEHYFAINFSVSKTLYPFISVWISIFVKILTLPSSHLKL